MPLTTRLFALFNELIFVLLGGLLILLAVSGLYAAPGRTRAWILLSAVLVVWGVRAWRRPDRSLPGWGSAVRAGSLILVGAMLLALVWLPFHYFAPLLIACGSVLALRGAVNAVYYLRG
jgi:hypothetical protein